MRERKRAWNTCNSVVHGLRFFYPVTLKRDRTTFRLPGGRQPATLPEMLSRDEVARVLAAGETRKQRALLTAADPTGMRVRELVHLTLPDLDAARGLIRIEHPGQHPSVSGRREPCGEPLRLGLIARVPLASDRPAPVHPCPTLTRRTHNPHRTTPAQPLSLQSP